MPTSAWSAAASTSASSRTIKAPLPPSSSADGRAKGAAAFNTASPPRLDPVKLQTATRGSASSAPAPRSDPESGGPPVSRLQAPGGVSGPRIVCKKSTQVSDARGLGLSTKGQPAATAGATFNTAWSSG